jgi:hypothetical protein
MVGDGEISLPDAGAVLSDVGIRIRGVVDDVAGTGIAAIDEATRPSEIEYRVHGIVTSAQDVFYDPEFDGQSKHAGCEFLMATASLRLTGEVEGARARQWTFNSGSPLTLRGHFEVIADYEWEGFDLPGERRDWVVHDLVRGSRFHMLDIDPVSGDGGALL